MKSLQTQIKYRDGVTIADLIRILEWCETKHYEVFNINCSAAPPKRYVVYYIVRKAKK